MTDLTNWVIIFLMQETIGAKIKEWRLKRGWTTAELARRAGVSYHYLVKIEGGKHIPRIDTARKLADALGVPLDWLYPSQREGEG